MKNFKRFVGLLLCLAMVLSFVPASVVSVAAAETESTGTTTTSDILEKIDLSGTVVGACSIGASGTDYANYSWYSSSGWSKPWSTAMVDGVSTTTLNYSVGTNERADYYLNLSGGLNGYTTVDKIVMYHGGSTAVSTVTITLVLADGTTKAQTFTPSWGTSTDVDPITWTLDQTYNVKGVYVYEPDNTSSASFGDIELYHYIEVNNLETATLNGVDISEYVIVYSEDDLDYAQTAAEYIQKQILLRTGRRVEVVDDSTAEAAYEILVGETNRSYSESISAPDETAMKFTFASNGTKIAMKADYFIIAGAAYYFVETYVGTTDFTNTANTGVTTQNTITKEAKNYIFMIGDGMGEMHTKLFEKYGAAPTSGTYGYSDGEAIFYGYYLPYLGWQKTANINGAITDSAAAGTALATGYKTINGYVGKDQYLNDVKNLSELAMELGKSVAVMSTEGSDGATPAAFSAHSDGRYNDDEIISDQASFGGLLIDGYNNYNAYTAAEYATWEPLVKAGLNSVAGDTDGFFIMYEEAHIDKVSHRLDSTSPSGYTGDTSMETLWRTVYRFNQAIGIFMEYALYNPETMVLITADHETAGLSSSFEPTEENPVDEQKYGSVWNHSLKNVQVFTYGDGAETFACDSADAYENASLSRTFAHLMTDGDADDFGNPVYPILGSGDSGNTEDEGKNYYVELPADATVTDLDTPTFGYYAGDTNGAITEYYKTENPPANLIDGQNDLYAESEIYTYTELEDGSKVPVILFEFGSSVNVVGITLTGYDFGRYNIEDFDVEVYSHDGYSTSWYTAATVRGAFTDGTYDAPVETPLEIGFPVVREATKLRIIVKGITNMSAEAEDDADSAELATGSYIRVREIAVYQTEASSSTGVTMEPIASSNTPTPSVGYYTDNNTDGELTSYYDSNYPPANLVDGDTTTQSRTPYYLYEDITSGAKIPAYVFEFDSARAFTGIEIDTYKAMYYGIEDFTVQVYTEANGWVTATTVSDSFGTQLQEEVVAPETYAFAEPIYGTKVRILVDKLWSMYDWRYDDDDSIELVEGSYIRLRGVTLMEDPDYVLPEEDDRRLKAPASLTATYISGTEITVQSPASTQYPEAVIQYSIYLNGVPVKTNTTGVFDELKPNTTYTVYAKYLGDDKTWLDSYTIVNTAATDKLPLPAPDAEVTLGTNSITATATPVEGGTLMYRLLDENHVAITGMGWDTTNTFTGLSADTLYYVQVKYDGDEDHYDSEIVELPVVLGTTLLDKPTLTVSGTTHDTITLNALAEVTGGVAEYSYSLDGTTWTVATGTVITGLDPNTTYYLRARYVATSDAYSSSLYSDTVTATTLKIQLPTPVLTVTDTTDSSITVTAPTVTGGTLKYRINGGAWRTSGAFTALTRNTEYTIEAMYVADDDYIDSEIGSTTATTLKTQLDAPNLSITGTTDTTITATADTNENGTLKFSIDGTNWQTSGEFTNLDRNTEYTVQAKYFANEGFLDSPVASTPATTGKTALNAPVLTVTATTESSITVSAPAVTGGTLQYRINGGAWQTSPTFTGLDWNTTYSISAMYKADEGYIDSGVTTIFATTDKPSDPTAGQYAYLEAIPESGVTPHVGYNNYPNHEMYAENTVTGGNISDAMFGTLTQIRSDDVTLTNEDFEGYKRLSVVYDLNAGATLIGGVELTGGDYNLTKFAIQVKTTSGVWRTVKFVTNDLFDISDALRNDTVLITFTPVTGTHVRLMIYGYEENANNAPEIREMVIYEVKEDAQLELKNVSSGTTEVFDSNKANAYTGTTATMYFDEVTGVKRLKLFGNTVDDSIGGYTVKVQTTQGGEWTEVATGTAFTGTSGENTCIVNLDQEYQVYGVQVIADDTVTIPEIEVYGYKAAFVPADPNLPDETPTDAPTRPTAVSPVQTTPAATEEFVVPNEPEWTETKPGNEGAWSETTPGNEGEWSDPVPDVPVETGTEPTSPTQATEAPIVMGWLDAIPGSQVTPQVGYYKNGDYSTLTEVDDDDEALYLNDSGFNSGADVKGTSTSASTSAAQAKTLVPAAVLTLNGSAKLIGGVELVCKTNSKRPTEFQIEVLDTSGTWQTVAHITDDALASIGTELFTFTPVEGTAVRVLVFNFTDAYPQICEITVFEAKTSSALVELPIASITTDTSAANSYPLSNLIDGNKNSNYHTFDMGSFTLSLDGTPASVSRLKIYTLGNGSHTQDYAPKEIVVEVQTASGWVEVYNGTAYSNVSMDTFVLDFDQAYDAYAVRLTVDSVTANYLVLHELELYGPGDGYIQVSGSGSAGSVGTTTVGSAGYEKHDLLDTVVGCDSQDAASQSDYSKLTWYTETHTTWRTLNNFVDGDYTNDVHWGLDPHERADVYLDLTGGANGYTAVDQIKLYHSGYRAVPTVYVALLLADGNMVENTFTLGWQQDVSSDPFVYTYDQTYNVVGLYVWQNQNSTASFSDIELYQKQTVQLEAPANLQATATTEDSITVAANTLDPAAAGTLKYQLKLGDSIVTAWTTDATFSGLTAGTEYTVEAMYVAADGYVDSDISTITVTTATPIITEFTVSGTVTAGATVQLYKNSAVVDTVTATDGSYSFSNVNIGNYTLVVTKAGHTAQMVQITVDKDLTVETITLISAYNVSGTTTAGATVTLYQGGAVVATDVADDGSYSFSGVALGNYTLVFTKTGYYTKTASITVSDANVTNNATLTATKISGTVDAGATVELYQNGAVVATDVATSGSYSFTGVALGNYTLVFSLTGYHIQTAGITLSTTDVTQNVTLVSALYTVSGTTTAGATVTLYQGGEVYMTTTADGSGNYSFSDVLIGNYALTFTKDGYISQGTVCTVSGNLGVDDVTLQPVPMNSTNVVVDAVSNISYNVRLYEPWALRVNVTFYTEKDGTPIDLSTFKSYGAYAIIAHKYGDGTAVPTSWEELISDPDAVQFKMAAGEGDGNIFATSDTTATFDFYDGLYTYRLAENVYWVAYYEDAEGIHFTGVNKPVLMDKVEGIIEKISGDEDKDTQRIVLEHMRQLHYALIDFRGEDAEFGQEYASGEYLGNVSVGDINNGTYEFGKTHKIRLIEPWSVKVTYQVRDKSTATMLDFADADDYGVIFYHDLTGEYYGNMTAAQMLERKDAVIYSKSLGNITLEDGKMIAVYDKYLYTYEMNSEIYCLPFVVVDGEYHYLSNASRIYLIDQMYDYYNNLTLSGKERLTFQAMIQLYESTTIHRKKYGK